MECLLEDLIRHIHNNMPELEVVDEDYGQLEMLQQEQQDTYPLTFPAVLIDTPSVEWSNTGELSQQGVTSIRVRLIIDCYDDTHSTSGTTYKIAEREKARHKLHTLLQGFSANNSILMRQSSRFYTVTHNIKVYEATYTSMITEQVDKVTISLKVTPKIRVEL